MKLTRRQEKDLLKLVNKETTAMLKTAFQGGADSVEAKDRYVMMTNILAAFEARLPLFIDTEGEPRRVGKSTFILKMGEALGLPVVTATPTHRKIALQNYPVQNGLVIASRLNKDRKFKDAPRVMAFGDLHNRRGGRFQYLLADDISKEQYDLLIEDGYSFVGGTVRGVE